MQNQHCYLEFDIQKEQNFCDLIRVFELIKNARNNDQPQSDDFWINQFPEYSIKKFYFTHNDVKPSFKTADKGEFTWHFYSLTSLLQTDYDIEYIDCFKLGVNKGCLEYEPFGYPYGGITGLITFVASFDCTPTVIDDGSSLYQITFKDDGNFSVFDLDNAKHQNSLITRFDNLGVFKKFYNWLKRL